MSRRVLISGDWIEIAPGVRIRGADMPNEEDMHLLAEPVLIEVDVAAPGPAGIRGEAEG